jgi:SAM-dependent methyltransferase
MTNICQGKDPKLMRVLEIGCGAGRVTRALAGVFGEVVGVDISGEMVGRRPNCAPGPSQRAGSPEQWQRPVPPRRPEFDFAFSSIVFQHIPSYEVIRSYVMEVHRVLRPGALFKFQVQGDATMATAPDDTWLGVPFSDEQAVRNGGGAAASIPATGTGRGQYFWLWFFKRP